MYTLEWYCMVSSHKNLYSERYNHRKENHAKEYGSLNFVSEHTNVVMKYTKELVAIWGDPSTHECSDGLEPGC